MITVVDSITDMHMINANPYTTAMLNNYCSNSMNEFLTYTAINPYQQGTKLYDLVEKNKADAISGVNHNYTPEATIVKTQAMLNNMALNDRDSFNQIYQIDYSSMMDIQNVNVAIQQYIMADPSLAEAYDKGMIDGYSTTYKLDEFQKSLPKTSRDSYIGVNNFMGKFDGDGDMYVDEIIVATSLDPEDEPQRLELSASDQFEISNLVDIIKQYRARGIDLTKHN